MSWLISIRLHGVIAEKIARIRTTTIQYSLFDRLCNIVLWQPPVSLKPFFPSGFPNKILYVICHLRTPRPTRKIPLAEAMKIIGLRFFL